MGSTKTRGHPYRRGQRFDAALGGGRTLHELISDPNVRQPDEEAEPQSTTDDDINTVLKAVLRASIGLTPDPKLVPPHLRHMFSSSITGERTRQLLRLIHENGGSQEDQALLYIFGLVDGRKVQPLELLAPASQLWPSNAAQQNAWTLLARSQATLRANLLIALASYNEEAFLKYLRIKLPSNRSKETWRKGTVDRLSAWRERLNRSAPAQLHACPN